MATIMEKESLIDLIAYATSIVALRMENSEQYEELMDFLAEKRHWTYATPHEEIDLDSEVKPLQEMIKKYKALPLLPQFQKNA
ncbi:hypothetical protein LNQ82_06515 [Conchiformibius steedae DSM 2580]|uniref:Uncharacterized protein n=1 Tax=Conchiformibius steedae DSM 2580 TaxID=1121352 RepID=A0AAE9HVA9_9NEIS|nr:hypothetical protein [Conchiformibius steedae]QMT34097.1 hypothetical protein H3L98_03595 [Conchiformibius steedae]URD66870.1 hypothetical protein LNQ82_06515 [Conchiformibius steedae DSM 2580]